MAEQTTKKASTKNNFQCETCGGLFERLFQSYADGSWQCGSDALELDGFMSAEQAMGIRRYLGRAANALKNFHAKAETKEAVANV